MASFRSLLAATRGAARGCRGREARRFLLDREVEVLRLQEELRAGTYRPSGYRTFTIRDPKPRTISAAAFRDRVVHHALCAEIEPDLERGAVPYSFASRPGKGTLAALRHAAGLVRRFPYVLRLDVEHFFETIDHEVLLAMLRARVRDAALVGLAEAFVRAGAPGSEPGRGVPIGNLTSQHFANFVLGALDRLVLRGLRASGYARYMDDVLVFAQSKDELWSHYGAIEAFVRERLRLRLKKRVTSVAPVSEGVAFLGWRLFPGTMRLDGVRRARMLRRLRPVLADDGSMDQARAASVNGVLAWSRWGPTAALRRSVLSAGATESG
jgi:retron-type reverse transcriptase